jgi:hypothetical protein
MDIDDIDDFVSEIKDKMNKIINYHGYRINIQHHNGSIIISFINSDGEECIGVDYGHGVLHLGNYYFNTPVDCLRIPNDWFFNEFLIPLGKALKVKHITLNDASSKKFDLCTVPMIFFALAGKQTFYNRYGFVNKKFDRYIEKLKKRTLRDIEVDNSLVLSRGKTLSSSLLKRLIRAKMLDKPIPEVAQFVLNTCQGNSSKNVPIVNDIIKYFKLKVIIENNYEHVLRSRSRSRTLSNRSKNKNTKGTLRLGTAFG